MKNTIGALTIGLLLGGMYVTYSITGVIWGKKASMTMDEYCQSLTTPLSDNKE